MRKQISLRLLPEAIARLDEIAEGTGLSSARVVERMVLRSEDKFVQVAVSDRRVSADEFNAGVDRAEAEWADRSKRGSEDAPGTATDPEAPTLAPPVEHPPRTKTIDTPVAAEQAVKQQSQRRRVNPMTGKPFGAVPK